MQPIQIRRSLAQWVAFAILAVAFALWGGWQWAATNARVTRAVSVRPVQPAKPAQPVRPPVQRRLAPRRGPRLAPPRVEARVGAASYRSPLGVGVASDPAPYTVRKSQIPRRLKGHSFGKARYVLMISLDGVSYDSMRRYGASLPLFKKLIKHGFFRPSVTVFPSVTWSAHASLATGQYSRHHGILGNRWLENFAALIYPFQADVTEHERHRRTPSLYDLAHTKGWPTAAINWPATQYARHITFNLPEVMYTNSLTHRFLSRPLKKVLWRSFGRAHRDRKVWSHDFFKRFLGRLASSEKIETDMLMRDIAVSLVGPRRYPPRRSQLPRLMMLHFVTPDTWLHKYGTSPWVLRWSLEQMERMIEEVIAAYKRAGIWKQTAFFLTSDHGFTTATHTMGIRQLLIREKISRYKRMRPRERRRERAMTFLNGHVAFIYVRPKHQAELLPKIIRVLRNPQWKACIKGVYTPEEYQKMGLPVPDVSGRKSLSSANSRAALPVAGTHQGAPSLLALSTPECIFVRYHSRSKDIIKEIDKPWERFGIHGYLPTKRDFWAFVLGHGPGIRARKHIRSKVQSVDIAPTIAHLLGLQWPKRWPGFGKGPFTLDGRVLKDVLKK